MKPVVHCGQPLAILHSPEGNEVVCCSREVGHSGTHYPNDIDIEVGIDLIPRRMFEELKFRIE